MSVLQLVVDSLYAHKCICGDNITDILLGTELYQELMSELDWQGDGLQLNGIPCVISESVPKDSFLINCGAQEPIVCTCGATKIGSSLHSDWCDL